ncbi:hypothetical protein C0J52_19530 [Blattella germanica]|nr:hypothetical protein C0J52_19530 [Blattella germanica]
MTLVSWMRKRDLHILTSSIFTYTGDARFGVIHPEASDEWNLRVEYVQKRDAGIYECQVNTEPKINMAILLNVEAYASSNNVKISAVVLCSKTQNLMFVRCSVDTISKCDEHTMHYDEQMPITQN